MRWVVRAKRIVTMKKLDAHLGALAADALSMPVHWYYDTRSLHRDYGRVIEFLAPKNPHADSILWRSQHAPVNAAADILHDQAQYWGQRGVHYHQFLKAGENTLNFQLARELAASIVENGGYDPDTWANRYISFMQTPGTHRDTYVEEYHRAFFNNLARGQKPGRCGIEDIHIGGLAHVPTLFAMCDVDPASLRSIVKSHVALTHKSPALLEAADCLVRMLMAIFSGVGVRDAILSESNSKVSGRRFEEWSAEPDEVIVGRRLSPACYIDDAFPAALYLAWKYADDFEGGIIANANVGGDNCHRGAVVGSILGLANGIPRKFVVTGSEACAGANTLLSE